MRRTFCLSAALMVAAAAASAAQGASVTQKAIGKARLGLTTARYAALLHERPYTTSYAGGTKRLAFENAQLTVFLNPAGRGVRITTASSSYTLGKGLGPCGSLAAFARAKHLTPVPIVGAFGTIATVYREGDLWFTLSDPRHIGSITLAAKRPNLRTLLSESQCLVSGEQGESDPGRGSSR